MKNIYKLTIGSLAISLFLSLFFSAIAVGASPTGSYSSTPPSGSYSAGGNCSNGICINPPSALPGDVCTLINNVMHAIIVDILPPIAALMVLYSAFLFLTSGGNTETVKKAKNTLLYTIIGIAIILVSTGIIYVVEDLLNVSHSVSICSTS